MNSVDPLTVGPSMIDFEQLVRKTPIREVEYHATLPSTNDRALQLTQNSVLVTPLLVITSEQTKGRGRGGNAWWSSAGALTFSIVWSPDAKETDPARWSQVSLVTGLAVHDALSQFVRNWPIQLKWPNDVFVNDRKICGILVEVAQHHRPQIVIGIGINVNNSLRNASPELQQIATSLTDVCANEFHLEEILTTVLNSWFAKLSLWKAGRLPLRREWAEHCYLQRKFISVNSAGRTISGPCSGIDDDGALLVDSQEGRQRVFSGVVQFWS